MGFLNNILKIFLGNKSKKDLKSLYPIVSKINSYSESYNKISNDLSKLVTGSKFFFEFDLLLTTKPDLDFIL